MKLKPLDIALKLYEIAGPIFVSLKEEVNSASPIDICIKNAII
jgi:hypothetical protein